MKEDKASKMAILTFRHFFYCSKGLLFILMIKVRYQRCGGTVLLC